MNQHLYQAILNFDLDQSVAFPFSKRLAEENGWTEKFALQAIIEYKKFIYLCTISHDSLTPSDQIDQVWHLHMVYTTSYWRDFCENTLGQRIEHNPTEGGSAQQKHFTEKYEDTLTFYKKTFQTKPPKAQWPKTQRRFGIDASAVRVHTQKHKVVHRSYYSLLLAICIVALSCAFLLQQKLFFIIGVTCTVNWLLLQLLMPSRLNYKRPICAKGSKKSGWFSSTTLGCNGASSELGCGSGCGGGGCGGGCGS